MPGWNSIAEDMEEAITKYWQERNEKMRKVRDELAKHFGIPKDTELSKCLALALTSDKWR